jgi:hypothetical protein
MATTHDTTTTAPVPGLAWTEHDVAAYLQCKPADVEVLRRVDVTFPAPRQLVFGERWIPELVIAWFTQRPAGVTGAPAAVAAHRKGASRG